jgi:hypothetical protein
MGWFCVGQGAIGRAGIFTGRRGFSPDRDGGAHRVRAETALGWGGDRVPRFWGQPGAALVCVMADGSIGFVVCEDNSRVFFRTILPTHAQEYQPGAFRSGFRLVLFMVRSPRDYQSASHYWRNGHVDDAVLVSMHGKGHLICTASGARGGRRAADRHDYDLSYVDTGNVGGALGRAVSALPWPRHGSHGGRTARHVPRDGPAVYLQVDDGRGRAERPPG